jgi:hypothetical protein
MISFLLKFFLGKELIAFIGTLVDALNPNSSLTVGFLFFNCVLAYQGCYAVRLPELRSSAPFWGAWAAAVGSLYAIRWLATRDSKFQPQQ